TTPAYAAKPAVEVDAKEAPVKADSKPVEPVVDPAAATTTAEAPVAEVPTGEVQQGVDTTALPQQPAADGTGWKPAEPSAPAEPQPQPEPAPAEPQPAPAEPQPAPAEQPPSEQQPAEPHAGDAQYGG
ncbi:MAG TPA: hypothetical protein VGW10_17165, partial [Solirubrobacteraceae bacterium]|nr:hypothetical protein [Solirubrobacteraceae bacterium]